MATITHAATATWTTATGNKTLTATPALNDLIVVVAPATGVATSAVTDNNSDGLGAYTKIGSSFTGFSTAGDLSVWIRNSLIGSATSTVFTATQTGSTGGGLDVFRISGMSWTGSAAVRSSGGQSSGTSSTTPAPVLSNTPLTGNPIITAVCNGTNVAGVTQPSSYTQTSNLGYNTPTTGLDAAFINSGITNATITWGSTSASAFASIALEFDTTAKPGQAGPTNLSVSQPVGVRVIRIRKGSALSTTLIPQAVIPPPPVQAGPPFYPKQAIRAKYLRIPIAGVIEDGRTSPNIPGAINGAGFGGGMGSNGAPVQNPQAGPVFYPANQAIRAKFGCPSPDGSLFPPRGRISSSPGAPVRNPQPGPVFRQRTTPVRFILPPPHPRAGRIGSSFGAVVNNPTRGPTLHPFTFAVRAKQPLPRRGICRAVSSYTITTIIPVINTGPPFYPKVQPVRAPIVQNAPRGRVGSSHGAPVRNPQAGPVFRQATSPARAVIPQTFSRGRIASSPGAPVRNPAPGPVFRQFTHPVRAEIPAVFSKGRVSGNPGSPVRNPVAVPPVFHRQGLVKAQPGNIPGRIYGNTLIEVPQATAASISYNTGTTASAITATSVNLTIPSGVLSGDLMVLAVTLFTTDASQPSIGITGGSWTLVGTTDASANPQVSSGSGVFSYDFAYIRTATGIDPGATITLSETGSGAGSTWWAVALASYTGAGSVDVAGGANAQGGGGTTVTSPSETTTINGDWAVYLGGGAPGGGTSFTVPAGTTTRQAVVSAAGVGAVITDSNGSLSSGSSVGGGTFGSTNPAATVWLTAFTTGIAPQFTPATPATGSSQFYTGRIGASWGAPIRNPQAGVPAPALHSPVNARSPLPARGRVSGNPGAPVNNPSPQNAGPPFYPARTPARARITLSPRGRVYSRAGAPVRNPNAGPVFRQLNHPARAVIPQVASQGVYASFTPSAPQPTVGSITFNTGNANTADTATSVNLVIPGGVLPHDLMLLSITCFTQDATPPGLSISGGTWNLLSVSTGVNPEVSSGSGVFSYGFAYSRIADGSDPGNTINISETGSGAGTTWWGVAVAAYTGAILVDVAGGATVAAGAGVSVTCPSLTTNVNGDWAVFLGSGAPSPGSSWVIPAGSTSREVIVSDAGIGAAISDSNGAVGNAGNSIGGGTFASSSTGLVWFTAFTVGLAPLIEAPLRQQYSGFYSIGRTTWSPGGAVENPPHPGPLFYQLNHPVAAKALPRMRGITRAIRFIPLTANPNPGPQFFPATSAIAAKLPKPFLKGRVSGNKGAPVHNPVAAVPFRCSPYAVAAQRPLPPRGRIASNKGAPVRNPQSGPVFRQSTSPARIRTTLPPRGRVYSNPGGPVVNPVFNAGPPFYPLRGPARARIPQNTPRGRISSSAGAPVKNPQKGPVFYGITHPVAARILQIFSKGKVSGNRGLSVSNPITVITVPLHSPVKAKLSLPTRGRISSNAGTEVPRVAPVYPLRSPIRAQSPLPVRGRIAFDQGILPPVPSKPAPVYPLRSPAGIRHVLPSRGRITGNHGAPVYNPNAGPVFRQAIRPIRAVIPQNAPRGRISANPGGPVENVPVRQAMLSLGQPFTLWETGLPFVNWATSDPSVSENLGLPFI